MSSNSLPYIETFWSGKSIKSTDVRSTQTAGTVAWTAEINKPINIDIDSLNYNVTILGQTLTSEELRDIVTAYYKEHHPEKLL